METLVAMLTILGLAFVQNVSFSIVSRSRNRNYMKYHLIAAFFSNTIWFLTFRQLIKGDMNFILFIPYCIGTMFRSVFGVKISMFIERLLGASADQHLKKELKKSSNNKNKCPLCNNTGKPCKSCGEYHRETTSCPPHEVRMRWVKNICPECGRREEEKK